MSSFGLPLFAASSLLVFSLAAFGEEDNAALAESIAQKEVVSVWSGLERAEFPVEVSVSEGGKLFVQAQYPDELRFITHKFKKVDRNQRVQITLQGMLSRRIHFDGLVKRTDKNELYAIGRTDSHPSSPKLLFRIGLNMGMPKNTTLKTSCHSIVAGACIGAAWYFIPEAGLAFMDALQLDGLISFMAVLGGGAVAAGYTIAGAVVMTAAPFDAYESDVKSTNMTGSLGKFSWPGGGRRINLKVDKIDQQKPWSEDNAELILSQKKRKKLTTWLREKDCAEALQGQS